MSFVTGIKEIEDKIGFLCFNMNGVHSGKHMQSIDSFAHEHVK